MVATAVLGLLVGCAASAPRPDATPVAEIECDPFETGTVTAGRVPTEFEPVAVLSCDPLGSREDVTGTWSGALLTRYEGDLAPLLDALAQPSDPQWAGACSAVGYVGPNLWFEGADGTFVAASFPATGCGLPKADDALAELERLTVTAELFVPSQLTESRAAVAAGCATQASVLVLAETVDGAGTGDAETSDAAASDPDSVAPTGEPDGIPWEPPALSAPDLVDGMRLCAYGPDSPLSEDGLSSGDGQSTLSTGGSGWFEEAYVLDAAPAQEALRAVSAAVPSAQTCDQIASRLVVAQPVTGTEPAGASFTVELDGCRRVIDPSLHSAPAPQALFDLLSSAITA